MQYTIESIASDGKALIRYPDGSWAEFMLEDTMTEEDVDDLAYQFRPKQGGTPSFLSEGASRTAAEKALGEETPADEVPTELNEPAWLTSRKEEYGTLASQVEYIVENGLAAWQTEVAAIKAKYPKT
jgi:hypothetical protein